MATATSPAPAPATTQRRPRGKTFTITFTIEGTPFSVIPLQPDPAVASKAYRLRKRTGDKAVYDLHLAETGPVCECKGFLRYGLGKDGKGCRHIRCLIAAGMFPPPPPKPKPKSAKQQVPQPEANSEAESNGEHKADANGVEAAE